MVKNGSLALNMNNSFGGGSDKVFTPMLVPAAATEPFSSMDMDAFWITELIVTGRLLGENKVAPELGVNTSRRPI